MLTDNRLFDYYGRQPEVFRPETLKNGTEEEKTRELYNWAFGTDNSVFVKWVPDEFVDDDIAREFFSQYGEVDRIDFVPKVNEHGKKSGHMAFVHFRRFDSDNTFSTKVVDAYPEPFEVGFTATNRFGNQKLFHLKCCVNTRPIPKVVEFNPSQMTDMIQMLNTRIALESVERARDKEEILSLKGQLASMLQRLDALERPVTLSTNHQ
jgi:hypothetical protein